MNRLLPFVLLPPVLLIAACSAPRDDLSAAPQPIGDFRLGHAVAVAPAPRKGPLSREASPEELSGAVQDALRARLSRYDGARRYHVGVSVEAYVLAQPGVPLVASPRTMMGLLVNVFDDETGARLTPEPVQLTVFEPCCAPLGGHERTREQQIDDLAFAAARDVEALLRAHPEWVSISAPGG